MATKTTTKAKKTTKRGVSKAASLESKDDGVGSNGGGRHLVIVESPAKARTIGRFLGSSYIVKASMGHVRDLPKSKMSIDPDDDFHADYQVMKDKKTIVADLKKAGENASTIYLATDPDREGEAISWHLVEAAGWEDVPIRRIVFHSITPGAVKEAFENERDIDMRLVNAQQARRSLDRLVGYTLSPVLWKKIQRGLSAGRVQSVALRLVAERDNEIEAFAPVEYWSLQATFKPDNGGIFLASLHSLTDEKKKVELPSQNSVDVIVADLNGASYKTGTVNKREVKRRPAAPFITSTLQQEASRQLRFSASKTMSVAQQLYEGINVGTAEGIVGLITYMRTDSPQVDVSAIEETRTYIQGKWGKDYLPASARSYTTKSKVAQEAHEAIRPTSTRKAPDDIRGSLTSDQFRLYELVWKRMVASQMADAVFDSTTVDIEVSGKSKQGYVFRATGSIVKFTGFRALYIEARDEDVASDDNEQELILPALSPNQSLDCQRLEPDQHFTKPPARFTEASLIKVLEQLGIGRPSTYAPTIGVIVARQYVTRERGSLQSTKLGQTVSSSLVDYGFRIMDPSFTAELEEKLDEVANGKEDWIQLLNKFYGPFKKMCEAALIDMPPKKVEEPTDEICEVCGRPMVIKHGRFGRFLSCSGFPECKTSRPMLKKTGAPCPKCENGELVERKGKGRTFFGCTNYPDCTFTVVQRPLPVACPECEGLLVASGRNQAQCTNCAYQGSVPEEEPIGVV